MSDDVFSQQTLKFCKSLVGKKLFKSYPSVYNNFRHLCFFTCWLTTDFQRVQQRQSSLHLHRRSPQVRDHSDEGHAGLPSSRQVRKLKQFFFFGILMKKMVSPGSHISFSALFLMGSDYYSLGLKFKLLKLKYSLNWI